MVKLVTIAVTETQKKHIKNAAQAHAKIRNKKPSVFFCELKSKLPRGACRGKVPGGKQHYLIKTTHALRRQVIKHEVRARVKFRGKWVSCYTKVPIPPKVNVVAKKKKIKRKAYAPARAPAPASAHAPAPAPRTGSWSIADAITSERDLQRLAPFMSDADTAAIRARLNNR